MNYKEITRNILKLIFISLLLGIISGVAGSLFAHTITFVTKTRMENNWLIFLLPLGGLLSVAMFDFLNVQGVGTNQILWSINSDKKIPPLLVPAVFIGSSLTHLLGGSAGREGAALQMGGGVAALFSKFLKLNETQTHILTICGMGAFFSALFGTPLGAAVFAIEVVFAGKLCLKSIIPTLISSVAAFFVSTTLKTHPERFNIENIPEISVNIILKIIVISLLGTLVAITFALLLHKTEKLFHCAFKNEYLRIFIGAILIIILTLVVGNQNYNGGGIEVINLIFDNGKVVYFAFALKIIFTCITVAAGFKGGEIVPTLFIGATFGGAVALLFGLTPGLGAAVGMATLFCGVTNCPIATIILCCEMFGIKGGIFCILPVIIAFFLSGKSGLYQIKKPYLKQNLKNRSI